MLSYAIRRLAHTVPLLFGMVVVVFLMLELTPGDPVAAIVGEYPVPPEFRKALAAEFHLDAPVWERLYYFFVNIAHGDLGYSYASNAPVTTLITERLPQTLALAGSAYVLGIAIGLVLGVLAAITTRRSVDTTVSSVMLGVYAIPSFWLGQILVIAFAVNVEWFPLQGMAPLVSDSTGLTWVLERLHYLALPMLTYALHEAARVARLSRVSVMETMGQGYIATARLKGLTGGQIIRRHMLRNSTLPVVTAMGYSFAVAIGGTVLIETVFSWPGVGLLLVESIRHRDNQVIVGIMLLISIMVILMNLLVDLLYAWLDPRTRRT